MIIIWCKSDHGKLCRSTKYTCIPEQCLHLSNIHGKNTFTIHTKKCISASKLEKKTWWYILEMETLESMFWTVIPLYILQVAIWLQLLLCDMQAKVRILFGKDTFDQVSCWQNYPKRLEFVKQLTIQLALQKEIRIPQNKTSQVMLQPRYPPTSFQTVLDFQSKAMIFVNPLDKYRPFYPFVV